MRVLVIRSQSLAHYFGDRYPHLIPGESSLG